MQNSINGAKLQKQALNISVNILRWAFFGLIAFVVIYPLFVQTATVFMTKEDIYNMAVRSEERR